MGNNPMVGATVAVAVSVEEAAKAGRFQVLRDLQKFIGSRSAPDFCVLTTY